MSALLCLQVTTPVPERWSIPPTRVYDKTGRGRVPNKEVSHTGEKAVSPTLRPTSIDSRDRVLRSSTHQRRPESEGWTRYPRFQNRCRGTTYSWYCSADDGPDLSSLMCNIDASDGQTRYRFTGEN